VAIRKNSPRMAAELTDFWVRFYTRQNLPRTRMAEYYQRIKQIQDPTGSAEWKRFEAMLALFRKYGERYAFAPLMLAAQGYQESQLHQNRRSQAGAIGIMQVMPAIGAEMKVGNIKITEPNIHAGAKYLDQLMTQYFSGVEFSEVNRSLFAFASYNAGPTRIAQMRTLAQPRGLDPNKWFNNVELVAAKRIGRETVTYVANIYKYYLAYQMITEQQMEREKAKETVKQGGSK
jgi:membrane-bound lytic murein transglycosylase MltF